MKEAAAAKVAPKASTSSKRKGKAQRPNYKTMPRADYIKIRQGDWYLTPRDEEIEDNSFWCMEQLFIHRDVYLTMSHPIRPMQPIKLSALESKPAYDQAANVIEKLGLVRLMELKCDYSVALVQQFFATLVMKADSSKTLKWMSGSTQCTATFYDFATALGYTYKGRTPVGIRLHTAEEPNKNALAPLYDSDGIIGFKTGLLPLYDQLVTIFRHNIAPSGGNNDAIRSALVNLLCLAHEIDQNEEPNKNFQVDVMDYIYHEMYDAMLGRYSIPYAPYIIKLIQKTLELDLSDDDCEDHIYKKVYVKKYAKRPAARTVPAADEILRDARKCGRSRPAAPAFVAPPVAKKMNWFQKYVLCMNADLRHGQYDAYCERQEILKRLPSLPDDPPVSDPLSYAQWNAGARTPWVQMEKHLLESSSAYARACNEEDESEEDNVSEDNDDEDEDNDDEE